MAPITIRAVVQAFKERIHTERDKAEFKGLCDQYTVVRDAVGSLCVCCVCICNFVASVLHLCVCEGGAKGALSAVLSGLGFKFRAPRPAHPPPHRG